MTARTKLAAFAVVLGVAFGGGAVLGSVVGPIDTSGDSNHPPAETPERPSDPGSIQHEEGH